MYIRVIIHEPSRVSISDLLLTSSCLCNCLERHHRLYITSVLSSGPPSHLTGRSQQFTPAAAVIIR